MAIARGRRPGRFEDYDREALLGQMQDEPMVDADTPYVRKPSGSARSPEPTSQTQPLGAPVKLATPETGMPAPETSAPGRTGWRGINLEAPAPTGRNAYTGFNDTRALAGGDPNSTKDAFRRWSETLPSFQGMTKDQIDAAITARVDDAQDYGLNISDVVGDQILLDAYENPGQPGYVDVVKNAGGANPELQWMPVSQGLGAAGAPATTNVEGVALPADIGDSFLSYLSGLGGKENPDGSTTLSSSSGTAPAASPIKALMDEIAAANGGQGSPMDLQALLQLLNAGPQGA